MRFCSRCGVYLRRPSPRTGRFSDARSAPASGGGPIRCGRRALALTGIGRPASTLPSRCNGHSDEAAGMIRYGVSTLPLISTAGRCAARCSLRRRNRARRRGKRSARRGGNRASRELPDQDGDARSGYEATDGSQPGSPSPLPNSGHELPEVSGVQSHGLRSLLPPFPSTARGGRCCVVAARYCHRRSCSCV